MSIVFGFIVFGVIGIALAAKDAVLIKMSLLMLASWSASNAFYTFLDGPHILAVNSAMDALFTLMAIKIMVPKGRIALAIPILFCFVAMMTLHFGFLFFNFSGSFHYYTALNILFAAQLLTLGAGGVAGMVENHIYNHILKPVAVRGSYRHGGNQ
jgi:hypothetical protein